MAENKINLKELFNEYDNAGNVPSSGFSAEQIRAENEKVKKTVEIIQAAFEEIKKEGREIFENFNVNFEITSVDNSSRFENAINAMSFSEINNAENDTLDVAVNFNYSKLSKLGSVEVYSIAYSTMHDALLKKKEKASNDNEVDFGKTGNKQNQKDFSYEPSILTYIKEFLENLFLGSNDFIDMDYTSCAKHVSMNLKQRGFSGEDFFDNPKGKNLFAERFAKVSKLGYQQQATALVGVFTKKEFQAIQSGSDEEVKNFCRKFANNFLQNCNVPQDTYSIEFTDNGSGDLGGYVDGGINGQKIVININEIRKYSNPAEILMTLAHELTHMVDSSRIKGDNKASRKGFGFSEHNLVGTTHKNAPDFVKRMEKIYYEANPHERSARRGELVALDFMMQMQSDETMKKYISKSLRLFQSYQSNLKTLQSRVDELIMDYKNNNFSCDEKTREYIDRVMEDLIKMKNEGLLDVSDDLKAIEDAEEIKNKNSGSVLGSELGE